MRQSRLCFDVGGDRRIIAQEKTELKGRWGELSGRVIVMLG